MPVAFDREVATDVGTSVVTMYTCPAATSTVVIGFTIKNTSASTITVTIVDAGTSLTVDIPPKSGFSPLLGKDVLIPGDTITVQSSDTASCDVKLSFMENT